MFGYLDAGTGSILLQGLLGGVAGIAVVLKLFGRRIWATLTFWKKRPDEDVSADEPESTLDGAEADVSQNA